MLSHSCEYTGIQIKLQSQPGAWRNWADGEQGLIVSNTRVQCCNEGGLDQKMIEELELTFSNRGDKIELLTKVVNYDSWRRLEAKK